MSRSRLLGFRSRKAAQVSATYLNRSGGKMDKLKLIRMLYLTERESLEARGRPIFYDEFYSFKDGPICSNALDCLNGYLDKGIWSSYVRREGSKEVLLVTEHAKEDVEMDELSESDLDIVDSVWNKFGWMSTSQIRKWTHLHCSEYTEIDAGRLPIDYLQLARALHVSNPADVVDHVNEYRSAEAALAAK
jgi:uncharacterized phage-associated protein